jgi:hypothetical protein
MSLCPGCGISYCLDCEKSVEPDIFRCEPCQKEHLANDPFVLSAQEAGREVHELEKKVKSIYDMLTSLQPIVHGSADQDVRDSAYHGVIEIRRFIKEQVLNND